MYCRNIEHVSSEDLASEINRISLSDEGLAAALGVGDRWGLHGSACSDLLVIFVCSVCRRTLVGYLKDLLIKEM